MAISIRRFRRWAALVLAALLALAAADFVNVHPVSAASADAAVLDGYGTVSLASGSELQAPTWNWPIARGVTLIAGTGSGYLLDGFGGVHPFGGAPAAGGASYWPNWDIARGIALDPCNSGHNSGYVLDAYGGVHPFGGAPAVDLSAYWPNWDIARGFALNSCAAGYVNGYVLDGYGGLHPFWQSGKPAIAGETSGSYWPNFDIARGVVMTTDGQGEVLDGYGGIHPFNGAPAFAASAYWPGWNIARGIAYSAALGGGYVLDGYGNLHAFGAAPGLTPRQMTPGRDTARDVAIYTGPAPSPTPTPTPAPTPVAAASVFVGSNGSDANPCTAARPCLTFQRAYSVASSGATISVAGGTYPYQSLGTNNSGLSARVNFVPCSGCSVVVQGLDIGVDNVNFMNMTSYPGDVHEYQGGHRALGVLVSGTNVTLTNFIAKGAYVWNMAYNATNFLWNGGEIGTPGNIGVRDCYLPDDDDDPMSVLGGTDITVQGVDFHADAGAHGPSCYDSSNGMHLEALRVDSTVNFSLRNSTFDDNVCPASVPGDYCGNSTSTVYFSYIHNGSWPSGGVFQNDFFGSDQNPTFGGQDPDCSHELIAYSTFHDTTGDICATWIGNLGPRPAYYNCNGTHSRNLWQDSMTYGCGTDQVVIGSRYSSDALGLGGADNFHLTAGSRAIGAGEHSYCTGALGSVDHDFGPRPASGDCDAGADQH